MPGHRKYALITTKLGGAMRHPQAIAQTPGHREQGGAGWCRRDLETPGLCMAGSLDYGNQDLLFDTTNQKGIENPHDLGT